MRCGDFRWFGSNYENVGDKNRSRFAVELESLFFYNYLKLMSLVTNGVQNWVQNWVQIFWTHILKHAGSKNLYVDLSYSGQLFGPKSGSIIGVHNRGPKRGPKWSQKNRVQNGVHKIGV